MLHIRRLSPSGFTLIELMIVVVVVAILASIAYPMYTDQVRKSRRGVAKADLVELSQRAERYHTVNNSYADFNLGVTAGTFKVSPREATPAYYTLSIANQSSSTFTLKAVPMGDQSKDQCGTLTLDQAGRKESSSAKTTDCW